MLTTLRDLSSDGWLLFATRSVRLFAYGGLSVVLVLYLVSLGLTESDVGLLLTATLLGDTLVSLILTTQADRIGRRRMLMVGAALMALAGLVFGVTTQFWLLVIAGTIGVISPSGQEVGPFLSIEQAALSQVVSDRARTNVFAWYALAGSLATALGALAAGTLTQALQMSRTPIVSYRAGGMEFRAKPMIGVSVAESYVGSYAVQFRVTDFDTGFKIGGEVRGPLSAKNPVILVYLAKDFGFKRLANFIVGGDDEK